jgi:hypothetical protein
MKNILAALLIFSVSAMALAEVNSNSIKEENANTNTTQNQNWSVEAQFNTISNSISPTFGPSLLYALNNKNQLGLRFLAPTTGSGDATASLMAVYRHLFSESKTSLLVEGTLGENGYAYGEPSEAIYAPSVGTNLGVIHRLNDDIAFGGLAGLEWTQTYLQKGLAFNNPSGLDVYARLSLFVSLYF